MRGKLLVLIVLSLTSLLWVYSYVNRGQSSKWRTRQQFAKAMTKIKPGMPQAGAQAVLGKPDDIRTQHDPGGIQTNETQLIWCYGTNGHLTTPTLGQIYIDKAGKVQYVFGGEGQLPAPSLFKERDLRQILRILDRVPSYNSGWGYDPRRVIQAVNVLQPLGKQKALAAITEYLRVASEFDDTGREGMFLVLRTLFEVPHSPGYMPPMYVGEPGPSPPQDQKRIPRFPIVLQDDIPFLVVSGYTLAGVAEPPEAHLPYFRKHGKIRNKALAPTPKPFEVLDKLVKAYPDYKMDRAMLISQVLWLVDSVYHVDSDKFGSKLYWASQEQRQRVVDAVSKLKIRWDAQKNKYTFMDGTSLLNESRVPYPYRREIWEPNILGLELTLAIERINKHSVSLDWRWRRRRANLKIQPATVSVFNVEEKNKPLAQFHVEDVEGSLSSGTEVMLEEGRRVVAEYTDGKRSARSPIYKP